MVRLLRHIFHPYAGNNHRPKLLHPSGFFALTTLALLLHLGIRTLVRSSSIGEVLSYSSTITSREVLVLTNSERAKSNLPELRLNDQLSSAASAKAWNMFKEQYWSHISPQGDLPWKFIRESGYRYSVAGENLARDFSTTPDMMSAWMNSPTHKKNIMNPKYKDIGIAVVDGKLLGIDTTLVVQMFGSPLSGSAQIREPAATTAPGGPEPRVSAPQDSPAPQAVLSKTTPSSPSASLNPLSVSKGLFTTLVALTLVVLAYDLTVSTKRKLVRIAGKNLAHILLFAVLLFLILWQRGGTLL